MSRTQLLIILVLVLGVVYGVFRNQQTREYIPDQALHVTDRVSLDKIQFNQITDRLSLDSLPENTATNWLKAKFPSNTESLPDSLAIDEETNQELETLSQRAVEVGQQTKQVLGASIQPAEEGSEPKPIYQSAVESGMYYYCKQVVNDYEKQHPDENK